MHRIAVVVLVTVNVLASLACCCQFPAAPAPGNVPAKPAAKQPVAAKPAAAPADAGVDSKAKRRAKAEAEAEAKNKANREAYDAEVARLTAKHEERVEQFKADKAAYDKAVAMDPKAMAEYDAGKKLVSASLAGRAGINKAFKEIAITRYREIIKLYPDTQAAKEAAKDLEVILKGGHVDVRKMPIAPDALIAPVAPRALKLPQPPQPVPIVYPPEPEEIAAAKLAAEMAARNAQKANERANAEIDALNAEIAALDAALKENHNQLSDLIREAGRVIGNNPVTYVSIQGYKATITVGNGWNQQPEPVRNLFTVSLSKGWASIVGRTAGADPSRARLRVIGPDGRELWKSHP